MRKNNLYKFNTSNPYFLSTLDTIRINEVRDLYVRTEYYGFGDSSIDLKLGYKSQNQRLLFTNALFSQGLFFHLFEDISTFYVDLSSSTRLNDQFDIGLSAIFNNYSTDTSPSAWHLPKFVAIIDASYYLIDRKLKLKPSLFIRTDMDRTIDSSYEYDKLGLDVSIEANYKVSKNFAAFLKLNNLLNDRYERWTGYETFSRNVQGGVEIKF